MFYVPRSFSVSPLNHYPSLKTPGRIAVIPTGTGHFPYVKELLTYHSLTDQCALTGQGFGHVPNTYIIDRPKPEIFKTLKSEIERRACDSERITA
jgi:hypothetical protein